MFPQLGQLASLLKNAGKIKENMKQMQERLKAARYEGQAGGGQVRATVDGRCHLVSLHLDRAAVQIGDVEMLEDLVCAAVNDAAAQARAAAEQEMQGLTGGLDMQKMMDMLGGTQA